MEPFDYTSQFNSTSTGLVFCSLEAAFDWAENTADQLLFYIVRTSKKRGCEQYFGCQCAARQGSVPSSNNIRRSFSKRTDCLFRGSIKKKKNGFWYIDIINGYHNHPLALYREGHSRATRLDDFDKAKVKELTRAQCKPKEIVAALRESNPYKPYVLKPVYNYKQRMRLEDKDDRNTVQQFLQVSRLKRYFTRVLPEPETNRVRALFWSNPEAIKLLRTYPQVLCIDATYGTNKYNFALVQIIGVTPTNKNFTAGQALVDMEDKQTYLWALQWSRVLLGPSVHPNAILTDRELGLIEPVQMVFPESHHILCLWHIKKMIITRAKTIFKNDKEAESLYRGSLNRMIKSSTVEMFQRNELEWRQATSWLPSFVRYIDETWMPHKEKFCYAWTNKTMHFGNRTTNRVESAHRALKDWFPSCTSSLDTLFERVHLEIDGQIKEVRKTLELSRFKSMRGYDVPPFMNLQREVSHECITLLHAEYSKPYRCNHSFSTTHGLPCKCNMRSLKNDECISLHGIDKFWQTLVFDEEENQVDSDPYHLRAMMQQVYEKDLADQSEFGDMIRNKLYPETCDYHEPEVKESKKGRPSKKKGGITRNLSSWEHVDLKYSRPKDTSGVDELDDFGEPRCTHVAIYNLPPYMRDYLVSVYDVKGDGNCGFRCGAHEFMGDENSYRTVREQMFLEVSSHSTYIDMYYGEAGYMAALQRIKLRSDTCHSNNWMSTEDLFAMAQTYRAMVSYYYFSPTDPHWACITFLPWRGQLHRYKLPLPELSIIYMDGRQHYVHATFRSNANGAPDHPLPPIHPTWRRVCGDSLRLLEQQYDSRLRRFESLVQAAGFRAPVFDPNDLNHVSSSDDDDDDDEEEE